VTLELKEYVERLEHLRYAGRDIDEEGKQFPCWRDKITAPKIPFYIARHAAQLCALIARSGQLDSPTFLTYREGGPALPEPVCQIGVFNTPFLEALIETADAPEVVGAY
jgi:hypothetical protein